MGSVARREKRGVDIKKPWKKYSKASEDAPTVCRKKYQSLTHLLIISIKKFPRRYILEIAESMRRSKRKEDKIVVQLLTRGWTTCMGIGGQRSRNPICTLAEFIYIFIFHMFIASFMDKVPMCTL